MTRNIKLLTIELKIVNPNYNNGGVNNQHFMLFFPKILKVGFQKELQICFEKRPLIASERKFFITFTSLIPKNL